MTDHVQIKSFRLRTYINGIHWSKLIWRESILDINLELFKKDFSSFFARMFCQGSAFRNLKWFVQKVPLLHQGKVVSKSHKVFTRFENFLWEGKGYKAILMIKRTAVPKSHKFWNYRKKISYKGVGWGWQGMI